MSIKPYDELPWWCQLLWPWFGPPQYERVEDRDAYLAAYCCAAARLQAQEIISHENGPPVPEDEARFPGPDLRWRTEPGARARRSAWRGR